MAELLRGEDEPDSSVELVIRRREILGGWQLLQATVVRSSAAELADLSRLLQLFSRIKKTADRMNEGGAVEEALALWTHTQDSHDAYHDAIALNTARLQREKSILVSELRELMTEMGALSAKAACRAQQQESARVELVSRLEELSQQIETLQHQQRQAVDHIHGCRTDNALLTQQVLTLQERLAFLQQQTEDDSKAIAAANQQLGQSKALFDASSQHLTTELQDRSSQLSDLSTRCAAATLRIEELEVSLQQAQAAHEGCPAKMGARDAKIVEQERALHAASTDAANLSVAHSSSLKQLQQLLDDEKTAHTAALGKTESLRREFLSADSTISALRAETAAQRAELLELQASHETCERALRERDHELKMLKGVVASGHVRDERQVEADMAPLRGHSVLVDAAISGQILLSQLTSRLQASQQECNEKSRSLEQSLRASEEGRQEALRKLELIMDEYDCLRDEHEHSLTSILERDTALIELQQTTKLSHAALQQALVDVHEAHTPCAGKILNLEAEVSELRVILAQVERTLGCPWPAFARRRLTQISTGSGLDSLLPAPSSVNNLLERTDATNHWSMSKLTTPSSFASMPRGLAPSCSSLPPAGVIVNDMPSDNALRAATPHSASRSCPPPICFLLRRSRIAA